MKQVTIKLKNIEISNNSKIFLIAGPCALESLGHAIEISTELKKITNDLGIGFVYKTSFDKANRSSIDSKRGVGLKKALPIFEKIKEKLDIPILTDVHSPEQCERIKSLVDIIQIPAFLCRQTDLLIAAAETNKIINVKKGQFLAPWDMQNVADKITNTGNNNVLLTERGTSFGYNNLVSDMRSIHILKKTSLPVIFDATHSVQQPGGLGKTSGGDREMVPILSKAAVAVGVAGVFIETHDNPDNAPSDGPNMVPLDEMRGLLTELIKIDKSIKGN
jgi:2-dehydro-3-deoxyphosphooctonate aldolase (KDO 8-P synthase)